MGPKVAPASSSAIAMSVRSALQGDELAAPILLDSLVAVSVIGKSFTEIDQALSSCQSPRRNLTRTIGNEWAQLESKMQNLGVRRFTVEGKPSGYVSLHLFDSTCWTAKCYATI